MQILQVRSDLKIIGISNLGISNTTNGQRNATRKLHGDESEAKTRSLPHLPKAQ